tara:strand:- start:66 stop:233 length:168 start_codon:yes stop_codon:yes gene_type:complete
MSIPLGNLILSTKSNNKKIKPGVIVAVKKATHNLFSPHKIHIKNITMKIPINISV